MAGTVSIARHAGACDDGGHPVPHRHPDAAKKTENQNHPDLIRWSIQQVRRIAIRLAQHRIQPAYVIAWSSWRRAHQAAARKAHIKSRVQL